MKAPFPLTYLWWKGRMVRNLIVEKREYVVLAAGVGLLSLLGVAALWGYGAGKLAELFQAESIDRALRVTGILVYALYLALSFMALANVTTRFFGQQRMDEREQLLGPTGPATLFTTELLDTLKLPVLVVTIGVIVPFSVALLRAGHPPGLVGLSIANLLALAVQPTLLVMSLYILAVRALPDRAIRSRFVRFVGFVLMSLLAALALSAIRYAFTSGASAPPMLPPSWVAGVVAAYVADDQWGALALSGCMVALTVLLASVAYLLYRFAFLPSLESFGGHRLPPGTGAKMTGERGWATRLLFRYLPQEVAGIVLKDLRSTRRDTAQRVAVMAMAAVISALFLVDLLSHGRHAVLFVPILAAYALFMVSCQGLSTFSAEGGLLENLAQLPIDARRLLWAKIIGHTLLFAATFGTTLAVLLVMPSRLGLVLKLVIVLVLLPLTLPLSAFLGWLTVCLGAIFPKPGQGGGRKEISVLAMGLFLELTTTLVLSLLGATLSAIPFGSWFVALVPVTLALWWGVVRILHDQALRAVERALGAEFRAG